MRTLVTGGAGYIGSVVVEELVNDGHEVVVYDDLSKGHRESIPQEVNFVQGNLLDTQLLTNVLRETGTEAVIHMAASSLVGESSEKPVKYFQNNLVAGISLLDAMRGTDVKRLVFSSTAAVYGEPAKQPIQEDDPTGPTNPYGETKLAFERALLWFERAYGIRYVSLRYFNAAGATSRCGEWHDPETHLVPILLQVALGKRDQVEIFGDDYPTRDGTCVRDYVHVVDLARAHILAMASAGERSATYNLGCGGDGYTVKEIIDLAREVTGKEIAVSIAARRPGDPAVLIASSGRIMRELGWTPRFQDPKRIIQSAWAWLQNHPESASNGKVFRKY